MNDDMPRHTGRETFLAVMLTLVLGGAFFFFLNFVSMGIFSYVLGAVVAMAAIGFLHYNLWGHAFSQETAGEREEEEERRRAEAEQYPQPDPYDHHKY